MKKPTQLLLAACLVLCAALSARAQSTAIKIGTIGLYEDTLLIALVSQKLLEEQGIRTELIRFSEQGILYAALSRGRYPYYPHTD